MSQVTCPTCRQRTPWHGNPHRPFCSLACRLIDLGVWLDERYRIPAEPGPDETPTTRPDESASDEGEYPSAEGEYSQGWRVS